jgi:hypothetical protein
LDGAEECIWKPSVGANARLDECRVVPLSISGREGLKVVLDASQCLLPVAGRKHQLGRVGTACSRSEEGGERSGAQASRSQ